MADSERPTRFTLWNTAFGTLCAMPLLLIATRAGADIGACFIAILFLAHCKKHHYWDWTRQAEIRVLGALWAFMVLASWLTPFDPVSSFINSLIWGRFVLFYAAVRYWLLRTPAALLTLMRMGFAIFILAAIDTIWQYQTGMSLTGREMISDRLTGALSNANIGNYLLKTGMPVLGLLTYHFINTGQRSQLWQPAAGVAVIISLVAVSGERSTAVLMLLALGVIGLTLFVFQKQLRTMVMLAASAITALIATLAATQPIIMEKAHFFVEQIADFENTYYGQFFTAAWKLWLEHPLTGIGPRQFLKACQPEILNVTYCDVHPHNMYFEWLASTGLPGIALFVAAMAIIGRRLWQSATFSGHAIVLTAFAFSQFCVLLFPFVITQSTFSNWPAILFWYSLALGLSLPNLLERKQERHV